MQVSGPQFGTIQNAESIVNHGPISTDVGPPPVGDAVSAQLANVIRQLAVATADGTIPQTAATPATEALTAALTAHQDPQADRAQVVSSLDRAQRVLAVAAPGATLVGAIATIIGALTS